MQHTPDTQTQRAHSVTNKDRKYSPASAQTKAKQAGAGAAAVDSSLLDAQLGFPDLTSWHGTGAHQHFLSRRLSSP